VFERVGEEGISSSKQGGVHEVHLHPANPITGRSGAAIPSESLCSQKHRVSTTVAARLLGIRESQRAMMISQRREVGGMKIVAQVRQ